MTKSRLITDRSTRLLPPRLEYDDVPYFDEREFDTVFMRAVRAAWNELFKRDLLEISIAQLARDCFVSAGSLYRHFPTLSDLAGALAERAVITLGVEMAGPHVGVPEDRAAWRPMEREAIRRYLRFAAKRPRHFALAYSGQFADPRLFPRVRIATEYQLRVIGAHTFFALGRDGTAEEVRGFHAILHGSAALSAAGRPVDEDTVIAQVERYFDGLRPPAARAAAFTDAMNAFAGGKSFTTFTSTNFGFIPVQTPTFACALNAAIDATNEPSSSTKNGTFHVSTSEIDGTAE